jgi:hypothetical protein
MFTLPRAVFIARPLIYDPVGGEIPICHRFLVSDRWFHVDVWPAGSCKLALGGGARQSGFVRYRSRSGFSR